MFTDKDFAASRGQAHTTEAILASLLILTGLLFAMQTTAVTPFSSTTEDKHLETQQRESLSNIATLTHENGDMKETVLYWNTTNNTYQGTGEEVDYYTDPSVNTPLLTELSGAIDGEQVVYNINVNYYNRTGTAGDTERSLQTQRLLRVGSPSNNAITIREQLALHDTDTLTTGSHPELQNTNADEFYMDSVNGTTPMYNYAEVEITAWRR